MKRVILALLGLLCAAGLCMAQNWQARHQIGTATQEMTAEGLSAAHNKIPIGSKAKVTNPANGLEIEVTIIRQIPESPNRIIDLSPSAARALDISSCGPVIVASLNQQNPSMAENSTGPSSEVELQMGKQPFHITINNYIINPDKPVSPENRQESTPKDQAGNAAMAPDTAVVPATVPAALPVEQPPLAELPVSPPVQPATQPDKAPLFSSPPVFDPQIIPGLPNPNTNKVYRLLVGTYPSVDNAFRIYQQLQAAGFDVVQEQAGDTCRVFAAGIPASRVYYAAKRLGAIGFPQIWIQE
jgi:cell division septation protein DedD